jgi:hypothetical protein
MPLNSSPPANKPGSASLRIVNSKLEASIKDHVL